MRHEKLYVGRFVICNQVKQTGSWSLSTLKTRWPKIWTVCWSFACFKGHIVSCGVVLYSSCGGHMTDSAGNHVVCLKLFKWTRSCNNYLVKTIKSLVACIHWSGTTTKSWQKLNWIQFFGLICGTCPLYHVTQKRYLYTHILKGLLKRTGEGKAAVRRFEPLLYACHILTSFCDLITNWLIIWESVAKLRPYEWTLCPCEAD